MEIEKNIIANIENFADKSKSQSYTRILVPFYQRPYKWEPDNIDMLFNDYYSSRERGQGHYFIGSAIACGRDNSTRPDIAEYEIIDGQQRLTTIFLLNYLRFLLGRSLVEDLLIDKISGLIVSKYDELIKYYKLFLGTNNKPNSNINKLEKLKAVVNDEMSRSSGVDFDMLLKEYRDTLGLVDEDDNNFSTEYKRALKNFFKDEEFSLYYARDGLNIKLLNALSTVRYSSSRRDLYPSDEELPADAIEKKYIEILKRLFNDVRSQVNKENKSIKMNHDFTQKCLVVIDGLLNNLQFCLLTSKDENDAYLLFEVLNDRGYEISDLELTKNMILKQYWSTTSDKDKENRIEDLDNLWDETFDLNLPKAERELIAYLGSIYLTGNTEQTPLNSVTSYRKMIKKVRFKEGRDKYNFVEAYNDIAFFKMCKIILESAKTSYKSLFAASFEAEKTTKTVIYKTISLLHALKCDGVLPAISNLLINDYLELAKKDKNKELIDLENFELYIENSYEGKIETSGYMASEEVYQIVDALRKAALMAPDYDNPRAYAVSIIPSCFRNNYERKKLMGYFDLESGVSPLKKWLSEWKYGNNKYQQHRIAVILMMLWSDYKFDNSNEVDKLVLMSGGERNFKANAIITLDHLEPQEIDADNSGDYFSVDNIEYRNDIIDRLGNMMILDKKNNIRKNNDPLEKGLLNTYDKLPECYLINQIKDSLNDNFVKGITVEKVPNDSFFTDRYNHLVKYFSKLLTSGYMQSTIIL